MLFSLSRHYLLSVHSFCYQITIAIFYQNNNASLIFEIAFLTTSATNQRNQVVILLGYGRNTCFEVINAVSSIAANCQFRLSISVPQASKVNIQLENRLERSSHLQLRTGMFCVNCRLKVLSPHLKVIEIPNSHTLHDVLFFSVSITNCPESLYPVVTDLLPPLFLAITSSCSRCVTMLAASTELDSAKLELPERR